MADRKEPTRAARTTRADYDYGRHDSRHDADEQRRCSRADNADEDRGRRELRHEADERRRDHRDPQKQRSDADRREADPDRRSRREGRTQHRSAEDDRRGYARGRDSRDRRAHRSRSPAYAADNHAFPPCPPHLDNVITDHIQRLFAAQMGGQVSQPTGGASGTEGNLASARSIISSMAKEDLHALVFGDDAVGVRIRDMASACPPALMPDVNKDDDNFKEDRIKCNAEMMRRCLSLCTAKTRESASYSTNNYVPYIMKAQARRNLQKIIPFVPLDVDTFNFGVWFAWLSKFSPYQMSKGSAGLTEMVSKVATSIADPGQADLELQSLPADLELPNAQTISTIGKLSGPQVASALKFTLADLQAFQPEKLHKGDRCKSLG